MASAITIRDSGSAKSILRLRAQHLGVLRSIRTMRVMDGGFLRLVGAFSPLSAFAPPAVSQVFSLTPVTMMAGSTCSPVGGFSPFSYSWARVSGAVFALSNPNAAGTDFVYPAPISPNESFTATYRCTVTDAVGQVATVDVPVFVQVNAVL